MRARQLEAGVAAVVPEHWSVAPVVEVLVEVLAVVVVVAGVVVVVEGGVVAAVVVEV